MAVTVITSARINEWLSGDDGLSDALREAMSLPDTDDALALLVDISGGGLASPFRISSNPSQFFRIDGTTKEPVHGTLFQGREYIFCPFQFELFSEEEGGALSGCGFSLQNVDESITASLRGVSQALDFSVTIVSRNEPGNIQMRVDFLKLVSTVTTRETISGELSSYDYGAEPCAPAYTKGEYKTLDNRA